jgi:hypothetical protein
MARQASVPPPRVPAPAPVENIPPVEARRPPKPAGVLFGAGDTPPVAAYEPPPAYGPSAGASTPYLPPLPAPSSGLPSWLLMLIVAGVVGGIVAGAVWWKRRGSAESPAAAEAAERGPVSAPASAHRYGKFIELSGFRITEDARKRAMVTVAVTNHSGADIGDLDLKVTLKTPDGKEIGAATLKASRLGPFASTDASGPLSTKLRAYEFPDWQFIRADFEITSP